MNVKRLGILAAVLSTIGLCGCATPLGQQYGNAAGLGGAVIGDVTGGLRGAVIGGAAGAVLGGAIGDSQSLQYDRGYDNRYYDPRGSYRPAPRCRLVPSIWIDRAGYRHLDYDHLVRHCD